MERKVRWQEKEMRKTRAIRVARMEAVMIWNGLSPIDPINVRRLALAYRAKQALPEATFRRWRKQEEAQMLVDQELNRLAEQHGITRQSVMKLLSELPDKMNTDSGLIESVKMQARLVDVPIERQTVTASFSRSEHILIPEGYEPPALPEHFERGEIESRS